MIETFKIIRNPDKRYIDSLISVCENDRYFSNRGEKKSLSAADRSST